MDMTANFRPTEIGAVPEDWEIRAVREFAVIQTGPFGTLLKASEYSGSEGVPLISVSEIREGSFRITDETPRVPASVVNRLPQYVMKRGDVAFGRKGGVDRSALIREPQEGWFLGSDGMRIRPLHDYDSEYLAFQFQSARVQGWLTQHAIGTTMPSLNQDILRRVIIPFPRTKVEQENIAGALSDAGALIDSLEQLIVKKRRIKQGAMQELLTGQKRLSGFQRRRGFRRTDIGMIPSDWEEKRLGEIGEALIGLTYKPSDVRSGGILVLRSSNIQGEVLTFDDNVFVEMPIPERIMVRRGDILICVRNGSRDLIGKCAMLDEQADGMTFGAFMAVFRSDYHDYVYHQFNSPVIKRQIHEHLGATINQITNKSLNSFMIPFPTEEAERTTIATVLSDMDTEITALEANLAKARRIKQGMMQELLTGRIRLT